MQRPKIIKETSQGISTYEIVDEMLQNRIIECVGTINSESVNSMISQILYLSTQDSDAEIVIYINSHGGEVASGLALYDVMKAVRCPIRTVCMGTAASMAAVIFAAGTTRDMLPHANVMIHDPLLNSTGGSALQLHSVSQNIMKIRSTMAEILAKHCNRSMEEILEKTATDSNFYGQEAVDFGLADKVIRRL